MNGPGHQALSVCPILTVDIYHKNCLCEYLQYICNILIKTICVATIIPVSLKRHVYRCLNVFTGLDCLFLAGKEGEARQDPKERKEGEEAEGQDQDIKGDSRDPQ